MWLRHAVVYLSMQHRYMVTELMDADLYAIIKAQALTDDHVQFLVYQIVRALKVCSTMPFNYWSTVQQQLVGWLDRA